MGWEKEEQQRLDAGAVQALNTTPLLSAVAAAIARNRRRRGI